MKLGENNMIWFEVYSIKIEIDKVYTRRNTYITVKHIISQNKINVHNFQRS